MVKLSLLVVMSVFFVFVSSDVYATNYYVSTGGDDNNTGALVNPFNTLGKAVEVVQAGDTVYIREGVYNEELKPITSGTQGNLITFQNYNKEHVIIDADGYERGVKLHDIEYIKIKGLEIKNAYHQCVGLTDYVHFPGQEASHNIIEGNYLHHCGNDLSRSGIYIGGHYNEITKNFIVYNGKVGDPHGAHGVYIFGNHNTISHNYTGFNASNGIRSEGEYNMVDSNIIIENEIMGFSMWADIPLLGEHFIVKNNLFINNPVRQIALNSGNREIANIISYVEVYNNTLITDNSEWGIWMVGGTNNVTIKNNIIKGVYSSGVLGTDNQSITGYEEDYNIFYGTDAFYYNGLGPGSFSEYQLVSGHGEHSYFGNPDLLSNYTPGSNSDAIENGIDVGLSYSGLNPTVGAFENGQDVCENHPIMPMDKSSIVYPSDGDADVAVDLTVTYGGYVDKYKDPLSCFSRASTHIQIDEQGENWSTLVYENTNAGNTTQEVTGLSNNTQYQVRVRHKNNRSGSTNEYYGDWSDTVSFTTQIGSTSIRADVDQQNGINSTDAMLTLRNSLSLDMSQTAWQESATTGDVNCDGTSNSTDAMLILRHSVGLSMSGTGWCE